MFYKKMCQKVNYQSNRRSSLESSIPIYGGPPAPTTVNGDTRKKYFPKQRENNLKFKPQISLDEYVPNLSGTTAATTTTLLQHETENMQPFTGDALAVVTQMTREFFTALKTMAQNGKKTAAYSVLTNTSQPAHVITVLVTMFIVYVIWPKVTGSTSPVRKTNIFSSILYLGSFATHFGAQIWMTFVSGLALYFSLPRHIFGLCQQILFPKYYALGAILSVITLFCYVRSSNKESSYLQVSVLTACAAIELIIRLYLAPPLLALMRVKHEFETKAGTGREVGQLNQGGLVNCPHYQKIHKTFRRIHMAIAIGNIISLVCTFIHLEYLASKINL